MTNPPGAMPPLPDEFWNLVENLRCQRTGDPVDSAHTKLEEYVNDLIHAQRLATTAEAKASIDRLSDILRRTANAIRGEPPESIAWGWVDLPERSTALIARVAELQRQNEAQKDEWLSWDSKRAALEKDAARYQWLKERLLAADFAWGEPATCVWVFETDAPISADLDASIDAAIAAKD